MANAPDSHANNRDLDPTAQRTLSISVTKTGQLMSFRENVAVILITAQNKYTVWIKRKVEFLSLRGGGTNSYHCAV